MAFIVKIDDPKDHACPGGTILGKALCKLKNPGFLEVKLRLIGEECTYYSKPSTRRPITGDQCWKIKFLKTRNTIIQRGYSNVGEHQFPFELTLPSCIPSSYLGKYGYVKYFLRAEMTADPKQIEEDEIELKIFAPIDLKDMPNVSMVPIVRSDKLTTKTLFCRYETIQMNVKLKKNSYVLGEAINAVVEVTNGTALPIFAVTVELFLKVTAKVYPPMQEFTTVQLLASDRGPGVDPHRSKTYLSQIKVRPTAELPNFQKCNLLSHKVFLQVTAVFRNCHKPTVQVDAELVLGHCSHGSQRPVSKNAKDFVQISPRPYGICNPSTDIAKSSFPTLPTRIPELYPPSPNGPNSLPPYQTDSKSETFFDADEILMLTAKKSLSYPLEGRSHPYPSNTYCPYPTEDNLSAIVLPTERNLPYTPSGYCPYPREGNLSSNFEKVLVLDGNKSPPYPRKKRNLPYTPSDICPYAEVNDLLSNMKDELVLEPKKTPPYPLKERNLPYLPSDYCTYPKGDKPSSIPCPYPTENFKKSQPYSTLPYPLEEFRDTRLFSPSCSRRNSCPYPTVNKFEAKSPYPKANVNAPFNAVNLPIEKKCIPYPEGIEEKALLLHTGFVDAYDLRRKLSAPSECTNLFQKDVPSQPAYITSEPDFNTLNVAEFSSPTFGKTAPYPPEKPSPHSTVGFAEITPMPMPPIASGSNAFAVPTTHSSDGLEKDAQPSAPLLSDFKTPHNTIDDATEMEGKEIKCFNRLKENVTPSTDPCETSTTNDATEIKDKEIKCFSNFKQCSAPFTAKIEAEDPHDTNTNEYFSEMEDKERTCFEQSKENPFKFVDTAPSCDEACRLSKKKKKKSQPKKKDFTTMTIVIVVDHHNEYFSSGQTIVGNVCCSLDDPHFIEVKIELVGEECTYYTESSTKDRIGNKNFWKVNFLQTENTVVGSGYYDVGEHKFPFELPLPKNVPSSYLGKYGYVKYFLKAYMISHSEEADKAEVEIKMFSPKHLKNLEKSLLASSTHFKKLVMYKWFFIPEIVNMDVKLEKTAFVVGETINVDVTLFNDTFLDIYAVLVELYDKVVAKVALPFHELLTVRRLLARDQRRGLEFGTKRYSFRLEIPFSTEIPNFQNCTLFTQKEYLKVTALFKDSTRPELKVEVDVVLGHYLHDRQRGTFKNRQDSTKTCPPADDMMWDPSANIWLLRSPSLPTETAELYPPLRNFRSSTGQLCTGPNPVPLYPTPSEPELFFDVEEVLVPEANKSPPYPVEERNLPYPSSNYCPYPKEEKSSGTLYPSVSICPYPTENDEKSQPLFHKSVTGASELPKRMPMPSQPTHLFQRNTLPYPRNVVPPYPIAEEHFNNPRLAEFYSSLLINTAPYPPQVPPPYPPPRYDEITLMPMPMPANEPPTCDLKGFAISHSNNTLEEDFQPSAPLWSDLKTPPTAKMEEIKDPFETSTNNDITEMEDKEEEVEDTSTINTNDDTTEMGHEGKEEIEDPFENSKNDSATELEDKEKEEVQDTFATDTNDDTTETEHKGNEEIENPSGTNTNDSTTELEYKEKKYFDQSIVETAQSSGETCQSSKKKKKKSQQKKKVLEALPA